MGWSRRAVLGSITAAPLPAAAAPAFIEALFTPAPKLWPRWQAHDPLSRQVVNLATWDVFLSRRVRRRADGIMGVVYSAVTRAERTALSDHLQAMSRIPVSTLNKNEQYAFWVNLYNALTVRIVLDHYPVASVRDINLGGGFFSVGPWSAQVIDVEGEGLSLNDIEHRILRPIWRDPRTHYVLNCASAGCPDLRTIAFTAAGLDAALDSAARVHVNHPRGVLAEPDGLTLSSIYNWFAEDFGNEPGVMAHLRRYATPVLRAAIDRAPTINRYRYDWSLNDVAG